MSNERPKNRLQYERSPYLQQHAHNPVDWRPWGEAAFAEAKQQDKLVFLSIGYSACHWCHVMEHESFDDPSTAALLNRDFISIKVDREERPDVDHIYQMAFQLLHQRGGGWPLSMFLTPDKKPFFGGTYFPPERRYGMPSFQEVLAALLDAYKTRRGDVLLQAKELTDVLGRATRGGADASGPIAPDALEDVVASLLRRADPVNGGFGNRPKFPNVMSVDLLLMGAQLLDDKRSRAQVGRTLDRMARGGIYDHLGGGFARYSVDEHWAVPHFEKMLYDNALMLRLYVEGARLAESGALDDISPARCRAVVEESVAYLAREMTDATGAFYSAQDADSEGEEGKFFVWTPRQLLDLLGVEDAEIACAYFEVTDRGNFEHGTTVLSTPRDAEEVARRLQKPLAQVQASLARSKSVLFTAREARPKPFRDEKSLASWNALLIGALADAGASWDRPDWVQMAQAALDCWRERAWKEGRLAHAMKSGEPYGDGFLDDYAGLAGAALDLFEATGRTSELAFARALLDKAIDLFWDEPAGDFYYAPRDGEVVLHRTKDPHDHAYPGGVGLAADALLRLATLCGGASYRKKAERLLKSVAKSARENPMGLSTLARAIDRAARGAVEVIILGDPAHPETRALARAARSVYLPHRALVVAKNEEEGRTAGLDPLLLQGRGPRPDGAPLAYVCRNQLCEAPVSSPEALRALLLASR